MKSLQYVVFIFLLTALTGCLTNRERAVSTKAHYGQYIENQSSALTIDQEETIDRLCPYGMPTTSSDWDWDRTEYVVRDGYALLYSSSYKIPLWVCERVTRRHLNGSFPRPNKFMSDPQLIGPQATLEDYVGSGYARGHNSPAENHAWSQKQIAESFYLSNMSPQHGPFNSGVWRKLESDSRNRTLDGRDTWIVTGSMLYDPEEEDVRTADGWVRYSMIGANVAVPTHLYKIIAYEDGDGSLHATAYVLPNKKPAEGYRLADYIRSVRWVEERTGINFFSQLSRDEAKRLEEVDGDPLPP